MWKGWRLTIERGQSADAVTSIRWAMEYMNRWQDRNGEIGNGEYLTEEQLTGLTLDNGDAVPALWASAKIEEFGEVLNGLRLVRSRWGREATITINPTALDTAALRAAWPMLLDRLIAD